jgi:hypothetical protein
MRPVILLAALLAPLTEAHYIFNRLIVNGASVGGEYAYTRRNSNSYNPAFTDELMNSNDLRCNKGAQPGSTATYTVKAGDKIGFKLCIPTRYQSCLVMNRRVLTLNPTSQQRVHRASWPGICLHLQGPRLRQQL